MKISKILSALIALQLSGTLAVIAQNGTMTPYSRYGYGILKDNATAAQRNMGGVGYAMSSGRQINVMNPASYAAIDSLTFLFDMGIDFTTMWQNETVDGNKLSDKQSGCGLDYITMQFPIGKFMGASFGILPYSSVGYSFGSEIENGATSRQGTGSINQLYLGLAGRIYKDLSVGVNVAYLFGSTFNDSYAYTSSGSSTLFEREFEVRDWRMDIGVQYGFNISRKTASTSVWSTAPRKISTATPSPMPMTWPRRPLLSRPTMSGYAIISRWPRAGALASGGNGTSVFMPKSTSHISPGARQNIRV